MPAAEIFSKKAYTHFIVYVTKIIYGVPYADVIKMVEEVEERHNWDQQLLQGNYSNVIFIIHLFTIDYVYFFMTGESGSSIFRFLSRLRIIPQIILLHYT